MVITVVQEVWKQEEKLGIFQDSLLKYLKV